MLSSIASMMSSFATIQASFVASPLVMRD